MYLLAQIRTPSNLARFPARINFEAVGKFWSPGIRGDRDSLYRHFPGFCDGQQTAAYRAVCHPVLSSRCFSRCRLTLLQKLEQVRIHPLSVRCSYAVWCPGIIDFLRAFDQLGGSLR